MLTHPAICNRQAPQEPTPEYANRVLGYALTFGPEPLTLEQLEIADAQAARIVAALPGQELSPDDARLDETLHTLRLRIATQASIRRRQRAQEARLLAALDSCDDEPDDPTQAAQGPGTPAPATDQERAIKLLRAALLLIMQPPNGNGPGSLAALQPPPTTRPPGGIALAVPGSDAAQQQTRRRF